MTGDLAGGYRLQPWRKLFHSGLGVAVAGALWLELLPRSLELGLTAAALAIAILIDVARLTTASANDLFYRWFGALASSRERERVLSSTWFTLSLLLTQLIAPRAVAVSAILVLALADTAAAWVGSRWGRRPFLGGSVEGSCAFAVVAWLLLAPGHGVGVGAVAALVGVFAERLPLDDNVSVPLGVAAALMLLT
jgi:dolichol kinase